MGVAAAALAGSPWYPWVQATCIQCCLPRALSSRAALSPCTLTSRVQERGAQGRAGPPLFRELMGGSRLSASAPPPALDTHVGRKPAAA